MRYSKLFGKTVRSVSKEVKSASHRYLLQGGFIRESSAGRYFFLPLGMRVRDKIQKIIEEEMDQAGGQKMITPVLHPLELWKETNRTDSVGFELMTVKDRRGAEFALGGTAEEMFVDVVRKFQISYKDLPFNVYQFSQKFRDELRARGGLLRVREFLMKDAYSFDKDEKEFKKTYELMKKTYQKIFGRMGLRTDVVLADNGYIGGDYCHEFVVENEAGESTYFVSTPVSGRAKDDAKVARPRGSHFVSEDGKYVAHEEVAAFHREPINPAEKEKSFETISQPKWVQTMDEFAKHYKLPKNRFLKNVVYKTNKGKIIIAVIRGDLEVNPVKLRNLLGILGSLEEANEEDLKKLGTKSGYVHSWDHKGVTYVGDLSLKTVKNFIGGQKEDKSDSVNVNYGRDFKCEKLGDIAYVQEGFLTEDKKSKLIKKKGIEVGNVFQLGCHYTDKMKDATFTGQDGKEKPYYMGCYGIGLGRSVAAIVEEYHDDQGIIWPESVAPFKVHLLSLNSDDKKVVKKTDEIYDQLVKEGVEVLYDDRQESAGVKFADADLIGIPYRIVISKKGLKNGKVEIKKRGGKDSKEIGLEKLRKMFL